MVERIFLVPLNTPEARGLLGATDPQHMTEEDFIAYGLTESTDDPWKSIEPVNDVLGLLTPRQRQILWLRFHPKEDGRLPTHKEIGEKIFYSPSTVGRELRAAIAKIPDPSQLYPTQR